VISRIVYEVSALLLAAGLFLAEQIRIEKRQLQLLVPVPEMLCGL
jgi:hypothetical protein